MEEKDVQKLIDTALENYTKKNAYGVSLVPAHAHTGVDSSRIDPANLLGFPATKVSDATVAPVDNPPNGTIRFYYDSTVKVMWVTINGTWVSFSTGTGNPSAPDTSIQFNNGGSFGGSSKLKWDGSNVLFNNPNAGVAIVGTDGTGADNGTGTGIYGGVGGNTDGIGGPVQMWGGDGGATNGQGGVFVVHGGLGSGSGIGGSGNIAAGDGGTTGDGGEIDITAGSSGDSSNGATLRLQGGVYGGDGGSAYIQGSTSGVSGDDGDVILGFVNTSTTRNGNFVYIPTINGHPTGTPNNATGVAITFDTTTDKLYIYNGGWKSVTLT